EAGPAAAQRGRRGRLPRPTRAGVRGLALGAARARELPLRRDRHSAFGDRLRGRRAPRARRRRLPQRDEGARRARQGVEALKIGLAGLGYWGPNLARNFAELAELTVLCDVSDERRAEFASRYPEARITGDFDELLASDVDAVVIATPVPTHYQLARAALG